MGKRSPHLMETFNGIKIWTTIFWRVNKFLKESDIVTRHAKERAQFLKINDINVLGVRSRRLSNVLNGQS
jgi:hypothetical protein